LKTNIEISREAAAKRRFLRRRSFWDAVMDQAVDPAYECYSYRERADLYTMALTTVQAARLREEAKLLSYPSLVRQLAASSFDRLQLAVTLGRRHGCLARAAAAASVDGQTVAEADLVIVFEPTRRPDETAADGPPSIHETAIVHPGAVVGEGSIYRYSGVVRTQGIDGGN
jgi:hypothetical protein